MSVVAIPHARFTPRERAVLLVLLGAGFMLSVDFSILTVALPDIGAGAAVLLATPLVLAESTTPARVRLGLPGALTSAEACWRSCTASSSSTPSRPSAA